MAVALQGVLTFDFAQPPTPESETLFVLRMDDVQQRTMALYLRDRASAFPDNENWCYGQYNETVPRPTRAWVRRLHTYMHACI